MKRRLFVLFVAIAAMALIVPATSLAAKKGKPIQRVSVKMSEFAFKGSKLKSAGFGEASILKPGKTRFIFNNRLAQFNHNFTIFYRSEGGTQFGSRTLDPGKKQRRTIDLAAGSYVAVCSVFNGFHASQGMVISFTVGTQSGDDGSWS